MKAKSVFAGIAILAVVMLLLSLSGVARLWRANPGDLTAGVSSKPMAAKFLPKRSPLVASLLVNPDRLVRYVQTQVAPSDRRSVSQEVRHLEQYLQRAWLLNYQRDLQDWLDQEITIAVTSTDLDRDPTNGNQPGYLLALASKDINLTKQQIDRFWQAQAGRDLEFEQYQGVSIIALKPNPKQNLAGAVFGKFALFANDPRVIRNAINDLQVPELALSNLPQYAQGLSHLSSHSIGVAFVNGAELGTEHLLPDLPVETWAEQLQAGMTVAVGLTPEGLRAETILGLAQPTKFSSVPVPSLGISELVAGQVSHWVGYDLPRTWLELKQTLADYPAIAPGLEQISTTLDQQIGVKFEQDILPWLDGAYALAWQPTKNGKPDWLLAVENHAGVDQAIAHLDQVAHEQAHLTVGEVQVNQQTLTVWTQLEAVRGKQNSNLTGSVVTVHTKTPKYTILASSVEAINRALTLEPETLPLPANTLGYAYIQPQLLPLPLPQQIKAINLVAIAPQADDPATIRRGEIWLTLGK
ncbi:MAG: DUF3352 domain-containing protein [Pseudanabaenaceae cyanobacterium bins.68]|nr:DUF3352 domain-containing protein [Pseudanabaenaceae cyanobacterium bins.68]